MATRNEMISTLRAKLVAQGIAPPVPAAPALIEGRTYRLELASQERMVKAILHHVTPDGFSFQLARRRLFVRNDDLRPGPTDDVLLAMV